jgi:hypothetical protein
MNDVAQPDKNFQYGFYCVAYLDILGQRRLLRALSRVPRKDEETIRLLNETAGAVLRLRKRLQECFEAVQQPTGLLDTMLPAVRERFEKAKQAVKYCYFQTKSLWKSGSQVTRKCLLRWLAFTYAWALAAYFMESR